ncbi:MAG: MCE family protein, partial [Candidatus Gastranaerophilales bacterium]|nr:MCE family protein [Candidatus Gastranaerophilales bacterium]
MNVVIKFEDLGPVYKRMPVYYKGYKIGITKKIEPSKDYKSTLVTVNFYPKELKLPSNTTAKVKKLDTGIDYIELLYPKNPSGTFLETGEIIEGKTAMDIQSFMSAQVDSGNL